MKKILNLLVAIFAVLAIMTACEDEEKSVNKEGLNPIDGMTGLSFDGIDNTSKVYSFKSGHIKLINFDDLTNPVMSNHYAGIGVHMYPSSGILQSSISPCNGSVALKTEPFTGPFIWFDFDLPVYSCSIEAGDYGPSDSDAMTLEAYSGAGGTGIMLGSVTQTLPVDHATGCLTLSIASLPGAMSLVVTSTGYYPGYEPFPNSIFVDNLVFENPIEVDIDIKPGSSPNAINCKNNKGTIPVAILTTPDFDALTVDETTVMFEGATDCHPNKPLADRIQDVDLDGDLDLVFHFKLADTALDCNSTVGKITGMTYDGAHILGHDEVTMK